MEFADELSFSEHARRGELRAARRPFERNFCGVFLSDVQRCRSSSRGNVSFGYIRWYGLANDSAEILNPIARSNFIAVQVLELRVRKLPAPLSESRFDAGTKFSQLVPPSRKRFDVTGTRYRAWSALDSPRSPVTRVPRHLLRLDGPTVIQRRILSAGSIISRENTGNNVANQLFRILGNCRRLSQRHSRTIIASPCKLVYFDSAEPKLDVNSDNAFLRGKLLDAIDRNDVQLSSELLSPGCPLQPIASLLR